MPMLQVNQASNGQPVELFYEDIGSGSPVVLIHGWPSTHAMWEYQFYPLTHNGYRVISYDRRGFGLSSKPAEGYDYDTLTDDLKALIDGLGLDNVTLVGFSMGGGEVARYMSRHHGNKVSRVVFVSSITPHLLKSSDNQNGVEREVFARMYDKVQEDRFEFLENFGKLFFGDTMLKNPVSKDTLRWSQSLAEMASPIATLKCIESFSMTDFRQDLASIGVPTLIVHGKDDKIVPCDASAKWAAAMMPHAECKLYDDGSHALPITHKDMLNTDLLAFLSRTESDALSRSQSAMRSTPMPQHEARH
ncbi:MAG TPA: alpha/beta hydrolase [Methylophilaceae bacterium]|nr:alpha/beta hydrolase [Methylophilaceae bacterium]